MDYVLGSNLAPKEAFSHQGGYVQIGDKCTGLIG